MAFGRRGRLGAQDPVAVDLDAADGEGVAELGRVDDVDLQEQHVGAAGDRVVAALFALPCRRTRRRRRPGGGWR